MKKRLLIITILIGIYQPTKAQNLKQANHLFNNINNEKNYEKQLFGEEYKDGEIDYGILEKAINLLPVKDKNDFADYVKNEVSFNQGNMFVSKSNKIIDKQQKYSV